MDTVSKNMLIAQFYASIYDKNIIEMIIFNSEILQSMKKLLKKLKNLNH